MDLEDEKSQLQHSLRQLCNQPWFPESQRSKKNIKRKYQLSARLKTGNFFFCIISFCSKYLVKSFLTLTCNLPYYPFILATIFLLLSYLLSVLHCFLLGKKRQGLGLWLCYYK
ncbi:hypothetical protein ERO13_D09G038150v2 [Gossypium hirsutum]|uniref:Uncharacterized protein n=2 Tax=Gossypium TaxID=3633 RepID=A0A5D2JE43_GOSTO|nr:hypothetical protein ERO13_D09G038150v2 [Gossypium hirsutum]TYH52692.1 hypothetical protein ES332_D09G046200v1 [Gossypium tomentosum]